MTPHPATYTDALLPIFAELHAHRIGEDFGPLRGYRQDRAPAFMASTGGILRL